jgi:hypothetical protein
MSLSVVCPVGAAFAGRPSRVPNPGKPYNRCFKWGGGKPEGLLALISARGPPHGFAHQEWLSLTFHVTSVSRLLRLGLDEVSYSRAFMRGGESGMASVVTQKVGEARGQARQVGPKPQACPAGPRAPPLILVRQSPSHTCTYIQVRQGHLTPFHERPHCS